jgi:hypothetical protein
VLRSTPMVSLTCRLNHRSKSSFGLTNWATDRADIWALKEDDEELAHHALLYRARHSSASQGVVQRFLRSPAEVPNPVRMETRHCPPSGLPESARHCGAIR